MHLDLELLSARLGLVAVVTQRALTQWIFSMRWWMVLSFRWLFFPMVCCLTQACFFLLSPRQNSPHLATFLSSSIGVVHLYGNGWFTLPLAVFKACFHHFYGGIFYLFICLKPSPHHLLPTGF